MSDSTMAVSSKYTQDLPVQIVFFTFSFKWFLCFYFWAVIWAILLTCSLVCMSLRQLARTLLKLAPSVCALLKPYGYTFHRENLKEIEEIWNQSQTDVKKWWCLSSFNMRLKALISEVTVEQQILALVYVSVPLIRKIAKRTRILTFDWGHWRALRDLA